jgi:NAD(P)-dependent dehydrogenase (short-subunit alcohol dehydrogenase family)
MLAREGARVAINYQSNEAAASETAERVRGDGSDGLLVAGDVSDPAQVDRVVDTVRERLGPIELLVNNAAIVENVPHTAINRASWRRMMSVNLDGPFLVTWAVKDEMIARRFGRIVNVASLAALIPKPDMIHYATSKAALVAFTRNCGAAFAPHNVRVNAVAPGLTATDMARGADPALVAKLVAVTPIGRMAQPEEMAAVVRFLLSEESSFVVGQTLTACGGRI